jgi:hypothetical protein
MLVLKYKLIYGQRVFHGEVESEMKPRMTCRQNKNLRQNYIAIFRTCLN